MSIDIKALANKSMSKNKIANYLPQTMVDGLGIRNAVYVSGCIFNCVGCYNKKIQNFNAGYDYDNELLQSIILDLEPDYMQGISILGGEPFMNTGVVLEIVREVRRTYGETKDIWLWTGFTYEELLESIDENTKTSLQQKEILRNINILVDGRFEQDLFKLGLTFRGSSNQRIIDTRESKEGNVVLWKNGDY